ncbi:MAG: iron ABC transporter permease [bacterium]|nr:iron ABC transporter permease [bacterium]
MRQRPTKWLMLLGLAVVVLAALNLGMGAVGISPSDVLTVLARRVGLSVGNEPTQGVEAVVWTIRMPRVLLGAVAGAGLAAAGTALQGVFRNPLADPQLLGIGPGAGVGAAIGAVAGGARGAIVAGTVAGVLTAMLVGRLARRTAGDQARFILVGVALGAALTAWVGFIVFGSSRSTVPPMEFWLLGSLTASTWRALGLAAVLVAAATAVLFTLARSMDLLALGDREAGHLGIDVRRTIMVVLAAVGIIAGATVGAVGVVGFVGLVVPNAMRRLVGPSHRVLLVASMLGGAGFVLAADLAARTVMSPIEIPVGLLTALVGGPFLLLLLRKASYS